MVGDVAAAAALEDLEPPGPEGLLGQEHVLPPGVPTQGEDGVVLEEEEMVGDLPGLALLHQPRLQLEGVGVADPPQPPHRQGLHPPT